jgi:hypothetical protein
MWGQGWTTLDDERPRGSALLVLSSPLVGLLSFGVSVPLSGTPHGRRRFFAHQRVGTVCAWWGYRVRSRVQSFLVNSGMSGMGVK